MEEGGAGRPARRAERALAHTHPPHSHSHSQDNDDPLTVTDASRPLGLCVLRGTAVMAVAPTEGAELLDANPFEAADEGAGA